MGGIQMIQIPIPGVSRPRQPVAEADGGAHSRAATHAASGDAGPQRRFQSRRRWNPRFPKLGIHGVQESATKSKFIDAQPDQPDQE